MLGFGVSFEFDFLFVLLVSILAVLTGVFFYRLLIDSVPRRRWGVLLGLRVFAILILLLLLFKPAIEFSVMPANDSDLIVLIDNSRSMGFADMSGMSRLTYVKKLIAENEDIIKEDDIRFFVFSDKVRPVDEDEIENLETGGKYTDITSAIRGLFDYVNKGGVRAIIVFTDGEHLGVSSPKNIVSSLNRPVYWLGVGRKDFRSEADNVSVDLTEPPIKIVADGENDFNVDVRKSGLSAMKVNLDVLRGDEVLAERIVGFSSQQSRRSVDVTIRPKSTGKVELQFRVSSQAEEYVREDNVRIWHCLSLPEKIRVLLIESQVSPEYKFLKQYLQSDAAIEFVSLVRIRAGKFLVTKQLKSFNVVGLPESEDDFKKFDLYILGNVSNRTFDANQIEKLKKMIGQQGKGVIFIAGDELSSLRKSGLSELLAIRIERKVELIARRFVPRVTLAGKASDILRNCVEFFREGSRYFESVRLDGVFYAGRALPASSVLMDFVDGDRRVPVLAVRPIGKGKSALLSGVGFWRWALNADVNMREKLYRVFWGQLIRNISGKEFKGSHKPALIVNLSRNAARTGESVNVSCYVFDESANAITSKAVVCEVLMGKKVVKSVKLVQSENHFSGVFSIDKPGAYMIRAKANYGAKELTDENVLSVYKVDKEFLRVGLNRKLLDELAKVSGTERMRSAEDFGEILAELRKQIAERSQERRELSQVRLFDYRVYLMLIFVVVVTSEWLLRYKWGLR